MMEADRDRELVDEVVRKIEAEERAEQAEHLRSRHGACEGFIPSVIERGERRRHTWPLADEGC